MTENQSTLSRVTPVQAYAVLTLGVLAVSLAAILIRLAQGQGLPSLMIAGGRLGIAALLLSPVVLRRSDYVAQVRQLSRRDLGLIVISGLFLAIHFGAWVTSLEYTTVLISVVLVTTTPIWVALLERVLLRAHLSSWVLLGIVIALIGGVLIGVGEVNPSTTFDSSQSWTGAGLALIGAMTVAVYLVVGRNLRARLALAPYIWLVYGCAALLLVLVMVISGTVVAGYSAEGYLWLLAVALIPQLLGHSSLNYALAYLPATYVSLATQLEPIFSALIAYVIFVEIPTEAQIVGGLVIIIGALVATLGQARRRVKVS